MAIEDVTPERKAARAEQGVDDVDKARSMAEAEDSERSFAVRGGELIRNPHPLFAERDLPSEVLDANERAENLGRVAGIVHDLEQLKYKEVISSKDLITLEDILTKYRRNSLGFSARVAGIVQSLQQLNREAVGGGLSPEDLRPLEDILTKYRK